jgi:hypothetical protein
MKKKVTLSIESSVYDDFQKYCDENAIQLSKKIELIMKDIMDREDGKHKGLEGGKDEKKK